MSGDVLKINNVGCTDANGRLVLMFSRRFRNTIASRQQEGYQLKGAKTNFIIYWKKPDEEIELKIVLPELYFER